MPNSEDFDGGEATGRANLFVYLTTRLSAEYRAIMDLFTGPLLADLSAAEVAQQLADRGINLPVDEVTERCERLQSWGNLVRGVRDARVPTVRDFLRSRSRYQASKLGGRVHRDAEAVLAAGDGAQEVARELLGATVQVLDRIIERLRDPHPDPETLAGDVTTVFNNQRLFNESVRDFYAYLNAVLSRYDLAGDEYRQFKELLLEYIDLITADVSRHAPAIAMRCERILPRLDRTLAVLETLPVLIMPDGTPADRMPGRTRVDWEQLHAWYCGGDGRSGPETLRAAADQALRQLLTNAKRMLAAAGIGVSRRADLLKLAAWFDQAGTEDAHRLYAASFGVFPARHLFGGPDEPSPKDGVNTSWWDATPIEVPVSLRDRGDRQARGGSASVPDPGLDEERLLRQAEAEARARRMAADELVATGALDGARVSPAARDLLLAMVGSLLAKHQDLTRPVVESDTDLDLEITAETEPGAATRVEAPDGTVVVHELKLHAGRRLGASADESGRTA
ncbi:TIGR02677 family protein [Amycolatopsis carbonis]|uniref:TIGR02677 family protein n=1 Tax=Amycolatopsis carbonis TaxID=715471 RepID=A0A9Y2IAS3_9PSEU|nr:TIGR02677 family protein [Amycolatopsis sp. 2-15]WIX76970.1 TIGR02677 family protein [Amycolatopsis sp. 2-15]